jgi:hypothetical protein
MAKLGIFTESPQRWLQFDEDTEVLLSYLKKEQALQLSKDVDKILSQTGSDRTVVWNQKLGALVVHGWRNMKNHDAPGFTYPDGSPIPYTPENRDLLMRSCREFSIFVGENTIDPKIFMEIEQTLAEAEGIKND